MSQLEPIWREAWRPPDRRLPWAWAEEHVHAIPYSPVTGRFRADKSPWLKEPLEALVDPKVRIVSILASIQSSKTNIGEVGLCYIIANRERRAKKSDRYPECELKPCARGPKGF